MQYLLKHMELELEQIVTDPHVNSKKKKLIFEMEKEILKIKKNNFIPNLEDLDDLETKKVEDELRKLGYI